MVRPWDSCHTPSLGKPLEPLDVVLNIAVQITSHSSAAICTMGGNSQTRTDPSERSCRTGSRDQRQALVGKNVGATTLHEVSAAFARAEAGWHRGR